MARKKKNIVIELKEGQAISKELIEEALGQEDIDTGDLGEPDEEREEKITFKRAK